MQTYWRNASGTITVRFDDLSRKDRGKLFAEVAKRFGVNARDNRDAVARFIDRVAHQSR